MSGQELVAVTPERMRELNAKHGGEHVVENSDLERVLAEIRAIAHSDITDFLAGGILIDEATGEPLQDQTEALALADIRALDPSKTKAIKKLKIKKEKGGDTTVEIELWDKPGALEKLMKYEGAYDKHERAAGAGAAEATLEFLMAAAAEAGANTFAPTVDQLEEIER